MRDAYDEIRDRDGEVVVLSGEPAAAVREAVGVAGLPYPVLSDPGLRVVAACGLRARDERMARPISRPALVVLDRDGVIRYAHVGEHPRDRPTTGSLLLALESLR